MSDRRPVTWKMLYCDQRLTRTYFSLGFARALFVLSFAPLVAVMGVTLTFGRPGELNIWELRKPLGSQPLLLT